MKLTFTLDMDNDAFGRTAAKESARILRKLASQIAEQGDVSTGDRFSLMDENGNKVGVAEVEGDVVADDMPESDEPDADDTDEDEDEHEDTGRYQGGYRTFRNGTEREDFGGDR